MCSSYSWCLTAKPNWLKHQLSICKPWVQNQVGFDIVFLYKKFKNPLYGKELYNLKIWNIDYVLDMKYNTCIALSLIEISVSNTMYLKRKNTFNYNRYTWWLLLHPILHVLCIRYLDNTLINSYWYKSPITGNFQIFIIFQNHTLWLPDSCTICSCLDPVSVCESVRCLNPNCFYSKVSRDHDHHYWKSSFVLFYLINF